MKYIRLVGYSAAALLWGAVAANAGRLLPDTATILRNLAPISTAEAAELPATFQEYRNGAWVNVDPARYTIFRDTATGCEGIRYSLDSDAVQAATGSTRGVTIPTRAIMPRIANKAGEVSGCRE